MRGLDGQGTQVYRVEIRLDVEAATKEDLFAKAHALAEQVGGEVTEILDENWEEVDR